MKKHLVAIIKKKTRSFYKPELSDYPGVHDKKNEFMGYMTMSKTRAFFFFDSPTVDDHRIFQGD